MKIIECKPGFPGILGQAEVKVPGRVYRPEVKGLHAVEPSFIVSMTQEELNLLVTLVGHAFDLGDNPAVSIWQALRHQVRSNRFVMAGAYSISRAIER